MIVNSNEQLKTFCGQNCFMSNLVSISGYLGLELSEESFYGSIGHKYYFGDWVHNAGEKRYPTLICFDADVERQKIIAAFKERNFTLKRKTFDNTENTVAYLRENISQDTPVIVNVDSFYLDYWPENIREHYAHYIIVYGISDDGRSIDVIDNYIPDTPTKCYKGKLNLNSLIKALDFEHIRVNHGKKITWVLTGSRQRQSGETVLYHTDKQWLESQTIGMMTRYQEKNSIPVGCYSYDYHTGLKALYAFKSFLMSYPEEARLQRYGEDTFIELYKNITSFGGPVGTMTIIENYLSSFTGDDSENRLLNQIRSHFTGLIQSWNQLGLSLFRYGVTGAKRYQERALAQLDEIISREKETLLLLEQDCAAAATSEPGKDDSFPSVAYLYPTMLCNLHCKMCYSGAHDRLELLQDEMDIETYQQLIAKLYQRGVRKFDISGGEPLLSGKFPQIVKMIKSYPDTTIYMVSNGTKIKQNQDWFLPLLKDIDRIYISIDSTDENIHNQIRGRQGAFQSSLEGLRILQKHGYKEIGINFLLMSDNHEQVIEILNFARTHQIRNLNLLRLLDVSDNRALFNQNLKMQTFIAMYQKIQSWVDGENQVKAESPLNITLVLPGYCMKALLPYRKRQAAEAAVKLAVEFDPLKGCMAFDNSIVISSKGKFTGCTAMFGMERFSAGSLSEQPLAEILDGFSDMKALLREREDLLLQQQPCKDCPHWRYCKGGCPAVAYKYYHTIMKNDPTCIRMQAEREGNGWEY